MKIKYKQTSGPVIADFTQKDATLEEAEALLRSCSDSPFPVYEYEYDVEDRRLPLEPTPGRLLIWRR